MQINFDRRRRVGPESLTFKKGHLAVMAVNKRSGSKSRAKKPVGNNGTASPLATAVHSFSNMTAVVTTSAVVLLCMLVAKRFL